MNEFEKRINALRRQFCAERVQITKDTYRKIGRINIGISKAEFPEIREALWAEKARLKETMRQAHLVNRECYLEQLELLNDEYREHMERFPSNRRLRKIMAMLYPSAMANLNGTMTIPFGDNRQATITFN